ncbi:hypothetical protein [Pectobacterium sp. B2J-2]|uniref:hypothetical protein n=1 Tax=Pectobacterium sp. B2J-2 TaxID=3385372 RepID=UPI0038FD2979
MPKKAKIYKAIISAFALFSFVHWGLDHDIICKIASETPQTCGYSERGLFMNMLGTALSVMTTASAAAILVMWIRKD